MGKRRTKGAGEKASGSTNNDFSATNFAKIPGQIHVVLADRMQLTPRDKDHLEAVAILHRLVTGRQSPATAVEAMTDHIDKIWDRIRLFDRSHIGPKWNSRQWEDFVYHCLIIVAMTFPATHKVQERIVSFVLEGQELSNRREETRHCGVVINYNRYIWTINLGDSIDYPGKDWNIWNPGERSMKNAPESFPQYIGFSAFLARLTGSGAMDLLDHCPLFSKSCTYFKNPYDKTMDVKEYEAYVEAAAQWILHASTPIYQLCTSNVISTLGLCEKRWLAIMDKLRMISAMKDRFRPRVCAIAKKAVMIMANQRDQKTEMNFVHLFRYKVALQPTDPDHGLLFSRQMYDQNSYYEWTEDDEDSE